MSVIDNSTKPVIAVDFDDTLCDSKFPQCGPVKDGAREALKRFKDLGYLILIYSCRTCHWHYKIFGGSPNIPVEQRPTVVAMREWLAVNDIPFDEIDDGSRGKPYAKFYVDDKGIRFNNNWSEIVRFVESKTSDNKN